MMRAFVLRPQFQRSDERAIRRLETADLTLVSLRERRSGRTTPDGPDHDPLPPAPAMALRVA